MTAKISRRAQQTSGRRSRGYSLMELMIALTLGFIVIAAVSSVFVNASAAFRKSRIYAELQDNAHFALWFLRNDIQRAGWTEGTNLQSGTIAVDFGSSCDGAACSSDGAAEGSSDRLLIQYEAVADCMGTPVNDGALGVVRNQYYIENENLICAGNATAPQTLATHISAMAIQYGVDLNGDQLVDAYVPASGFSNLPVYSVISVNLGLLVAASEPTLSAEMSKRSYQLLDQAVNVDDRYARQMFKLTVALQNRG